MYVRRRSLCDEAMRGVRHQSRRRKCGDPQSTSPSDARHLGELRRAARAPAHRRTTSRRRTHVRRVTSQAGQTAHRIVMQKVPPASWFQRAALATIDFYQRAAAGRLSPCRFAPSCSSYAREAFEVHGGRRGAWLTARRLLRCRPFGPSGWDPVPELRSSACAQVHLEPADSTHSAPGMSCDRPPPTLLPRSPRKDS